MTNGAQVVEASYDYDAFGTSISESGPEASLQPYRFNGKWRHRYSALYDYGYRFYSPSFGMWMNRDPIGEAGGINLYQFNYNNPVNYADPDGLIPIPLIIAGGYMAFEAAMVAYDAYDTGKTLLDPCKSDQEKSIAGGLFIAGLAGPGGGYNTIGKAAKKEIVVIGEGMDRVRAFADEMAEKGITVRTYPALNMNRPVNPNPYGSRKSLDANQHWINYWARKKGADIIDIGRQPGRPSPSPYYTMEKRNVDRWESGGAISSVARVNSGY